MRTVLAPHRGFLALCLLMLVLGAAPPALGFGSQGHRVIGAVAQSRLSPATRAIVHERLDGQSLAEAGIWADEMRAAPDDRLFWGYEQSANWHFVNIPAGRDYAGSRKHRAGDAYVATLTFITVLEGGELPRGPIGTAVNDHLRGGERADLERLALRFLIHLVGDLHQPLHAGHEEDRGGNGIPLRWFGRDSNLHRVWDSQLLSRVHRSDRAWIARLEELADAMPAAQRERLARAAPDVWLEEALDLRRGIYAVRAGAALDQAYVDTWTPALEQRLLAAALRLATLLEGLFGHTTTE